MVQQIKTLAGLAGAFYYIRVAHRLCLKGCQLWDGLRLLVFRFSPESWEGRKRKKRKKMCVSCWQRRAYIWLNPCPCKKVRKKNKTPNWRSNKWGWENACFLCLAAFLCHDFLCFYLCPFFLCGAGAARQENLTHCLDWLVPSPRGMAVLRKKFLSVVHLWRHISSHCCGLLTSNSLASKIK